LEPDPLAPVVLGAGPDRRCGDAGHRKGVEDRGARVTRPEFG
jgi:hypothetical protein